jgi:pyruvate dehydrogenase E1 component beta subunit
MGKLNMVRALNLALLQEMEHDPDVLVMGEDVGVDGGVFRVTEELHRKFGATRVIDSPLAESAIIGTAVGMALYGLKPVCEIQFSGFGFQCFHQIENHAARYRMRSHTVRWSCGCPTAAAFAPSSIIRRARSSSTRTFPGSRW